MTEPFIPGLAPNLIPNPPSNIPEAPGAGDATARLSPFREALDVDAIIKNLVLDRPLKLYVPNRGAYPDFEFRIINSVPREMADAKNKGWMPVDDPSMSELFNDLVAGTDEQGKAFRPILMARPKRIGEIVRKRHRQSLASLYAGMDPTRKEIGGKYAKRIDGVGMSEASFGGDGWRIRV